MDPAVVAAVIAAGAVGVYAFLRLYNGLISARNAVDNTLSTIDVQLKLRCDLVPRVVEAVRGHLQYERGTLDQLIALRTQATAPGLDVGTRVALDTQIAGLLTHVFGLAEQYPDLKASNSVIMLQRTLNEVEAQIAAARRTYNAAVTEYNTQIQSFPANLVAGILGFDRRALFAAAPQDRAPIAIAPLRAE